MTTNTTKNNQFGIKFLLTTFSLTLVLGFWNLFAKKEQSDFNNTNQQGTVTELWNEPLTNEMALPTLVPLGWTTSPHGYTSESNLPTDIREVSAPTPRPGVSQQQAPLVENVTMGQPQPVSPAQPRPQPTSITTTGSSK
jgi:hypothetical protein